MVKSFKQQPCRTTWNKTLNLVWTRFDNIQVEHVEPIEPIGHVEPIARAKEFVNIVAKLSQCVQLVIEFVQVENP